MLEGLLDLARMKRRREKKRGGRRRARNRREKCNDRFHLMIAARRPLERRMKKRIPVFLPATNSRENRSYRCCDERRFSPPSRRDAHRRCSGVSERFTGQSLRDRRRSTLLRVLRIAPIDSGIIAAAVARVLSSPVIEEWKLSNFRRDERTKGTRTCVICS